MRKLPILLVLTSILALSLLSTQVLASPAADPKKTPGPKTPGAQATDKAIDRLTKQAGKPKGKHENYKGTIAALDSASLTLTLRDGSSVTIGLSAETRIKVPGAKEAGIEALQPGLTAMVQAIRDQNGSLTARAVQVIPGKPTRVHMVGWVSDYQPGASITVLAHDGGTYTFALTGESKILPEERAGELAVGSRVTIIARRDSATGGWMAFGIVVHPADSGAGSLPQTPTPAP